MRPFQTSRVADHSAFSASFTMHSWLLEPKNTTYNCPDVVLAEVMKRVDRDMWQINGIMLFNVIIILAMVSVGVCASRYRRHPIISFIFNGANTLFLPIVTDVVNAAMTSNSYRDAGRDENATTSSIRGVRVKLTCSSGLRIDPILIWTGLVIYFGISTCAVVAGDPREGRNVGPSKELLIKVIWVAYLMGAQMSSYTFLLYSRELASYKNRYILVGSIFVMLVASSLSKLYHKYRVFYVAKGSLLLGRNPRLIVSYMAQHLDASRSHDTELEQQPRPSLIVMEGGTITLEQQPRGYSYTSERPEQQQPRGCRFRCGTLEPDSHQIVVKTKKGSKLVTLDRVRGLDLSSTCTPQAKDLCFSFALFKLLRCRFAKYTASEAGLTKARNFFGNMYAQNADYKRVFRVIADELSFFHDYYYSSTSIPFFHHQFLYVRVFNQILSTSCCLLILVFIKQSLDLYGSFNQAVYLVDCFGREGSKARIGFGSYYFDMVPVCFVLAAVLISEMRETLSYLCSNFTKVVLICNYISNTRSQKFVAFAFKKFVAFAFEYLRCEWLLNNWDDKMGQCKLLVFNPWEASVLFRSLFRLPNQKKISVPSEVKEAIFKALQGLASEPQGQVIEHIRFPRSPISGSAAVDARSACGGKGAAVTILVWHVTTSIFEVKQLQPEDHQLLGCKTTAVRLSQYCAYLVCYRPELLPDDAEWCKTLHQAVKKEAARVLANNKPAPGKEHFQHLVDSLGANSTKHEVLRNGATLAQKLKLATDWVDLARFWVEMILYIAPSEKLDEHAEAISRGGELVTLLWALLAHAGIIDRLDDADSSAATSEADGRVPV